MTYFRAVAILFILLGHTIWGAGKVFNSNVTLFVHGTVYFVFIAGFLFQYLSYKFNYKEYLKKKFFNVIMPYIVTTIPFAIILSFTLTNTDNPLYYLSKPMRFISCFPCGVYANGVTWFVGMISIFFLLAPVFLKLEKNRKVWYTLLAASILYSIFVNRPSGNILKYIDSSTSAIKIWLLTFYATYFKSFLHFLSSYIGGMTLCIFVQKYPDFIHKYKKQILAILFTVFLITYVIFTFVYFRADRQFFIKMIIALITFCLLYIYEKNISSKPWLDKSLKFLAEYSFGIFFIHARLIISMTYNTFAYSFKYPVLHYWENTPQAFLSSLLVFFVGLFGSIAVLWLIKTVLNKLGVKNTRMFIGV